MEKTSAKKFFQIWIPVAITWFLMSLEGPTISAIVARFTAQEINLAAFGIAMVIANMFESPILMLFSASSAMVKNRSTYYSWRKFSLLSSFGMSLLLAIFSFLLYFKIFTLKSLALPENLEVLIISALIYTIPWPATVGMRRFYQGLIITTRDTRRLIYGTIIRYSTVFVSGYLLLVYENNSIFSFSGAEAGIIGLTLGLVFESIATKFLAGKAIAYYLKRDDGDAKITQLAALKFYAPLAATIFVAFAASSLLSLFLGYFANDVESLAVIPVVSAYIYMFRSIGLSLQEVAIAWQKNGEDPKTLTHSTVLIGSVLLLLPLSLSLCGFAGVWYSKIGNLNDILIRYSLFPTLMWSLLPLSETFFSYIRSKLILTGHNSYIFYSAILELVSIFLLVFGSLACGAGAVTGSIIMSIIYILARLISCSYLYIATRNVRAKFSPTSDYPSKNAARSSSSAK